MENGLVSEKRANVMKWLIRKERDNIWRRGLHVHLRRGPICHEMAYMQREGQHLEKKLIFEEGQYVMRWLICTKRDNIWRRGLYSKRANIS